MILRMFFLALLAAVSIPAMRIWADEALSKKPPERPKLEILEYLFPVGTPICRTADDLKAVLRDPDVQAACRRLPAPLRAHYTRDNVVVVHGKPKQLILIEVLVDQDKDGAAEEIVYLYSVEPITLSDHRKQRG